MYIRQPCVRILASAPGMASSPRHSRDGTQEQREQTTDKNILHRRRHSTDICGPRTKSSLLFLARVQQVPLLTGLLSISDSPI